MFYRDFIFEENSKSENLTTLVIKAHMDIESLMSHNILKLIGACRNLICLETSIPVDNDRLKGILTLLQNLTTLRLPNRFNKLTVEFIEILWTYGKKLNHFDYIGARYEIITEKLLQRELKHQFKNIKLVQNSKPLRDGPLRFLRVLGFNMNNLSKLISDANSEKFFGNNWDYNRAGECYYA